MDPRVEEGGGDCNTAAWPGLHPLEWALRHARNGWRVVPVVPGGKRPLVKGWKAEATTDEATVRAWWARWPDANVGGVCGPGSFVVIDYDPRSRTRETVRVLNGLRLPPTRLHLTGGGGMHVVYQHPGEGLPLQERTVLAPGLDVRGNGALVVLPGSTHESGRTYSLEDDTAAGELPATVLAMRRQPTPRATAVASRERAGAAVPLPSGLPEHIPVGERHATLQSVAGWLRGYGLEVDAIRHGLEAVAARCEQPAGDPIRAGWLDQLAASYAAKPTTRKPSAFVLTRRVQLEAIAARWQGRNAARDRRGLLLGVLPILEQPQNRNMEAVPLAARTVAQNAGMSPATASRVLRRLGTDERNRVLELVARHERGTTAAAVYRLSNLKHASVATPPLSEGVFQFARLPVKAARTVFRRGRWNGPDGNGRSVAGLGWIAGEMYAGLTTTPQAEAVFWKRGLCSRRSVRRILERLQGEGLATYVEGEGWVRGAVELEAVAERMGGRALWERRRAVIRAERADYARLVARWRRDAQGPPQRVRLVPLSASRAA